MAHVARRGLLVIVVVGDPRIHAVLLAGVEVVEPRGDEATAAEIPAILVREDVVGVVAAGAGVAKRPEELAGSHAEAWSRTKSPRLVV